MREGEEGDRLFAMRNRINEVQGESDVMGVEGNESIKIEYSAYSDEKLDKVRMILFDRLVKRCVTGVVLRAGFGLEFLKENRASIYICDQG